MIVKSDLCELCGRDGIHLTRHHLIPRARHRNKRIRRQYDRVQRSTSILWLCQSCHNHIHAICSEKELAIHYNSRERLLSHAGIRRFVGWIKNKPAGFKPKGRKPFHKK